MSINYKLYKPKSLVLDVLTFFFITFITKPKIEMWEQKFYYFYIKRHFMILKTLAVDAVYRIYLGSYSSSSCLLLKFQKRQALCGWWRAQMSIEYSIIMIRVVTQNLEVLSCWIWWRFEVRRVSFLERNDLAIIVL